jgi:hypothetical protein
MKKKVSTRRLVKRNAASTLSPSKHYDWPLRQLNGTEFNQEGVPWVKEVDKGC